MTANELLKKLHALLDSPEIGPSDGVIMGDANLDVDRAAVCFRATVEVIEKAIGKGYKMLICHEPVFMFHTTGDEDDPLDMKKKELIEKSGIVIVRLHDHPHRHHPDFIHAGFLRALGLEVAEAYPQDSFGVSRYRFKEKIALAELEELIYERVGKTLIRSVGPRDITVETVCLGLGSVGFDNVKRFMRSNAELLITGELDEIFSCEYVRDAVRLGEEKTMILLSHYGAEDAGMRYFGEFLAGDYLPTEYIDCGRVYSSI